MLMLPPVAATDLSPQEVREFYRAQGCNEKQADHQALQLGECVTEETFMIAKAWEWITEDLLQYLPMDVLIRLSFFYARKKGQAHDKAYRMLMSAHTVSTAFCDRPVFRAYYTEYERYEREASKWAEKLSIVWAARRGKCSTN